MNKLAICVDPNPQNRTDYRIWYLELDQAQEVVGIGVMSKEEILEELFAIFSRSGESNWRCFQKDQETSTSVELFDFVTMNQFENTHFGNLPTLNEFQNVVDSLNLKFKLNKASA